MRSPARDSSGAAPPSGRGRPAADGALRRAALALALVALAMAGIHCETLVPRQSWSHEWGPMVPHRTFPMDCATCHVPTDWSTIKQEIQFDHAKDAGRPLEGAHASAACLRCHNDRGPVRTYAERGCAGCHVDSHKGSLGLECAQCHSQTTWEPQGLIADHARTRFPLSGGHALAACESCHARATVGDFRGAPASCAPCHQEDARKAFPPHAINGWTRDCERCHTPANWTAPGFNHTAFPLAGGHAGRDCLSCHASGRFAGTPTDCFSCHRTDYLRAPDHVTQGRSTQCTDCHRVTTWQDTLPGAR